MLPLPIPFALGELWGYELPFWADKAAWSPEPVPAMALEREVVLVLQRMFRPLAWRRRGPALEREVVVLVGHRPGVRLVWRQ